MAKAPQLKLQYESEDFPATSGVSNGFDELATSWNELLWAAVTVGRPNRQYVFRHGDASSYEALFRWSLMRMALEQRSPTAYRLRRTDAARTLDPTEKGAVSYFLGMTIAKLFCDRLLNCPWMMHLDVFRPMLNTALAGRSRPDLVGEANNGDWVAIESKGRVSAPNADAKDKAKAQAERLLSVNGLAPALNIGAITYFRNDVLHFFWRDPRAGEREPPNPMELSVDDSDWQHYYRPVLEIIHSRPEDFKTMLTQPLAVRLEGLDIQVGILPDVLTLLAEARWADARRWCIQNLASERPHGYQADGITVAAGESWLKPFEESGKGELGR